jgi:hypothetical protein
VEALRCFSSSTEGRADETALVLTLVGADFLDAAYAMASWSWGSEPSNSRRVILGASRPNIFVDLEESVGGVVCSRDGLRMRSLVDVLLCSCCCSCLFDCGDDDEKPNPTQDLHSLIYLFSPHRHQSLYLTIKNFYTTHSESTPTPTPRAIHMTPTQRPRIKPLALADSIPDQPQARNEACEAFLVDGVRMKYRAFRAKSYSERHRIKVGSHSE